MQSFKIEVPVWVDDEATKEALAETVSSLFRTAEEGVVEIIPCGFAKPLDVRFGHLAVSPQ